MLHADIPHILMMGMSWLCLGLCMWSMLLDLVVALCMLPALNLGTSVLKANVICYSSRHAAAQGSQLSKFG